MKLEEFDSLKFDLELLQDEKSLLETEFSEINEHVRDLESKLHQAQT
jgi:predicted  nucleic acid-binding Zn-ribbon protein